MGLEPQPYRLTVIQLHHLSYQVWLFSSDLIKYTLKETRTPNLSLIKGLLYQIKLSRYIILLR